MHIITLSGTDPRLRMGRSTHMLLMVTSWCITLKNSWVAPDKEHDTEVHLK